MSQWKKIEEKLISNNRNITFEELRILFNHYGLYESNKGKTSGSRVAFVSLDGKIKIDFHKPHGKDCFDMGAIKSISEYVRKAGLMNE